MLGRIRAAGLDVALALTSDQAVALCVGNHFAVVVLDAVLIRKEDWSVAKSFEAAQAESSYFAFRLQSRWPWRQSPCEH